MRGWVAEEVISDQMEEPSGRVVTATNESINLVVSGCASGFVAD